MRKLLIFGFVSFLAAALAGDAGGEPWFDSDFGPGDGAYDPASYAPSWDPVSHWEWSAGAYPNVVWRNDPASAPVDGNGYFKEGVRDQADLGTTGEIGFSSDPFEVPAGAEIVVRFSFKMGTSIPLGQSGGHLQLRFLELSDPAANMPVRELHQTLFLNGVVIGDNPGGSADFDGFTISEPDANGWVDLVLTATVHEDAGAARVFFQPWTGVEDFYGSYGVDNLSVATPGEEVEDGLHITRAVEVEFHGEPGQTYRVESSEDSVVWTAEGGAIQGAGEPVRRVFAGPDKIERAYRVVAE